MISADLANSEEVLNDSVLDVLGAERVHENKFFEGPHENIDLDELAELTAADFIEDFIEQHKDSNMAENENIIEGEYKELPEDKPVPEVGELDVIPTDEELANLSDNNEFNEFSEFTDLSETSELIEDFETQTENNSEILESSDSSNDLSLEPIQNEMEVFELTNDEPEELIPILENYTESTDSIDPLESEVVEDFSFVDKTEELSGDNSDSTPIEEQNLSLETPDEMLPETLSEYEDSDNQPEEAEILDEQQNETSEISPLDINTNTELNEEIDFEALPQNIDFTLPELTPDEELSNLEEITPELEISTLETFDLSEDLTSSDETPGETFTEQNEVNPVETENSNANEGFNLDDFDKPKESEKKTKKSSMFDGFEGKMSTIDDPAPDPLQAYLEEEAEKLARKKEESDAPSPELYTHEAYSAALNRYELSAANSPEALSEQFHSSDEIDNTVISESEHNVVENTESNDEFSGLEEFTMDMAAAVEQANPNLHNSQIPQNAPNNSAGNLSFEMSFNENPSATIPSTGEEHIQDEELKISDSGETLDLNVFSEGTSDVDLDNVNLDVFDENNLDDTSIETDDIESEIDNILNSKDIDLSGVDFDNIDTSDIDIDMLTNSIDETQSINTNTEGNLLSDDSLPIQSNADSNDLTFLSETPIADVNESFDSTEEPAYTDTSLSNIPDLSDDTESYKNLENEFFNDEQTQQQEYVPDFEQNDQNTIQQLYEDNNFNQNPQEAIDNSFDANNVDVGAAPIQDVPTKKKSSLPFLLVIMFAALGGLCYMQKDFIMQKINEFLPSNKSNSVSNQNNNMPIEGENRAEDTGMPSAGNDLPQENTEPEISKQPIGDIPGEAGGPQDPASMENSLKQKATLDKETQTFKKEPQPLQTKDIKRLYWEIPQDLTYNASIVNYLKSVGKTAKFAIQSDLLNTTEFPFSNKMIVNAIIKNDGAVDNVEVSVSSGSKQIDEIVLQSVKAALKYVKAPTSEFTKESYEFSLIINF